MNYKLYAILLIFILIGCKSDDDVNNRQFLGELNAVSSLGGSLNEDFTAVAKTTDNGFVACGIIQSEDSSDLAESHGNSDYLIVKYDLNLIVQWSKVYGGSSDDRAKSIIQTLDGGFVISGYAISNDFDVSNNNGQKDFWIIKLDSNGNLLWEKNYGFSGDDEGFSIIQTQDGGFFATGYLDVTASGGQGNDDASKNKNTNHGVGDFWAIKLDNNGDFQWRRYFGGTSNDRAYNAIQTSNGDFILVGAAESENDGFDITDPKGSYDFWIVRITNTGNLIWQKSFGGSEIEECYKIITTNDGNFFIVGKTLSSDQDILLNHGSNDIFVIKMNPLGNAIWKKTYGGNQFDTANSIIQLNDGNYMIVGNTRSDDIYTIKGQNDALLIKIDINGNILNEFTFGGTKIDSLNDVIETDDNRIIAVGSSSSNDLDIITNNGFTDTLVLEIK